MPLERHLGELRYRVLIGTSAFLAAFAVAWFLAPGLLHGAISRLGQPLVFTQPGEAFSALVYVAVIVGLALSAPVILYQLVAFVVPGLTRHERRVLYVSLPVAAVLFLAGALFAYRYIVPFAWRFLLGFATPDVQPLITVSSFLAFLVGLVVPVGLVFEWPLVVWALARLGLLPPVLLRRGRRVAYVLILIVGAAVTPPDVTSQMLVAVPLGLLYEVGVWLAGRAYTPR